MRLWKYLRDTKYNLLMLEILERMIKKNYQLSANLKAELVQQRMNYFWNVGQTRVFGGLLQSD